jgi:hypothetical protein
MADFDLDVQVIDAATRRGIPGLRVEAWDLDTKFHDLLGVETTNLRGEARFRFDELRFGDFAPDRFPDVFFRVYRGEQELKSTQGQPMMNLPAGRHRVLIEIDNVVSAPAPRKPDRISGRQALSVIGFVRKSDFRGAGGEVIDKGKAGFSVFADLIRSGLSEISLEPIQGPKLGTRSVVGQDVVTARRNLEGQQVEIVEVKQYEPAFSGDFAKVLVDTPGSLKPGDRVNVYEQDGKVKYYTIVRDDQDQKKDAAGDEKSVELRQEVAELKTELKSAREDSAAKHAEIKALKAQLSALSEAQGRLAAQVDEMKRAPR